MRFGKTMEIVDMKDPNPFLFRKDSRHNRQADKQNHRHAHDSGFPPVIPYTFDPD
jgi:hypothetical protein